MNLDGKAWETGCRREESLMYNPLWDALVETLTQRHRQVTCDFTY